MENHINMRELQRKRSKGDGKDKGACGGVCLFIFVLCILFFPLFLHTLLFLFLLKFVGLLKGTKRVSYSISTFIFFFYCGININDFTPMHVKREKPKP